MSVLEAAAQQIEKATVLDGIAERIQSLAGAVTQSPLDEVLGGDAWLGHPAHPVAAQLPMGAFVMSTVLDLVNDRRFADAVDLLSLVGVVTALPTAVTGVHDWATTVGGARRVGLVHAATMDTTLALFVGAIVARRRGDRRTGRKLALAGVAVAAVGGYLGGHLAYRLGVGVRR